MKKLIILLIAVMASVASYAQQNLERKFWSDLAYKMAKPVLEPMSRGCLQKEMQLELSPTWDGRKQKVAYMEAFGRLLAGVSPWLALPDDDTEEGKQRAELRKYALGALKNAVDPESPDYLLWKGEGQALVDAAYLVWGLMHAWDALWVPLDDVTKQRYIDVMVGLRVENPPYTNWLLFCASIETFIRKAGGPWDVMRCQLALRSVDEWYVGDGFYSDGPDFAFDYYNAYVLHPMFVECNEQLTNGGTRRIRNIPQDFYKKGLARMQRYGMELERLISPEGTFPVYGRSITYRTGVLQPLALLSWRKWLPKELQEGQVRAAMTAVLTRMFGDDRNFNKGGYLTLGFNGSQPNISDWYTNNGSLYMASLALMPLGLPASDSFWTCESLKWTSKKAWEGDDFPRDHAVK